MPPRSSRGLQRFLQRKPAEQDEAIATVLSRLEDNLAYFVDSIGGRVGLYEAQLQRLAVDLKKREDVSAASCSEPNGFTVRLLRDATDPLTDGNNKDDEDDTESVSSMDSSSSSDAYSVPEEDERQVVFPSNDDIRAELQVLKQAALDLATTSEGVGDWLTLNLPKVTNEDDEPDYVAVMRTVMMQSLEVSQAAREVYDLEGNYFAARLELERDVVHHPHCQSMFHMLLHAEDHMWNSVLHGWRNLMRLSLILYSLVATNWGSLQQFRDVAYSSMIS